MKPRKMLQFRPNPKTSHQAKTPDTAVSLPKRKLWLRRSRTHLKWPREVSKLKANKRHKNPEEDSRTTKLEEAVEIAEAEAEVDLATLPMVTKR